MLAERTVVAFTLLAALLAGGTGCALCDVRAPWYLDEGEEANARRAAALEVAGFVVEVEEELDPEDGSFVRRTMHNLCPACAPGPEAKEDHE